MGPPVPRAPLAMRPCRSRSPRGRSRPQPAWDMGEGSVRWRRRGALPRGFRESPAPASSHRRGPARPLAPTSCLAAPALDASVESHAAWPRASGVSLSAVWSQPVRGTARISASPCSSWPSAAAPCDAPRPSVAGHSGCVPLLAVVTRAVGDGRVCGSAWTGARVAGWRRAVSL